jgi:hypothetical protein
VVERERRILSLIAVIIVGLAAARAAGGNWASAGMMLGGLVLFSAISIWRASRLTAAPTDPVENETRTRRLIARVLPVMIVFFGGVAVYLAIHGDWSGAAWFVFGIGWSLLGIYLNRRWLAEKA